jgi:enoyl-CoA hydratase
MADNKDILLERKERCGLVTLNRPQALNAISYDMIAQMERHYIEWGRDAYIYGIILQSADKRVFCSGGDLKALYAWWKAGKLQTIKEHCVTEYQHNWTLDRFIKPHVSLIDGYVFGGGVGISLYGTHKVAGPNYRFAMPEVRIGFFPDVGASYFLSRLPGQIGLYLALTGVQIDRADAFALGLVTHCIDTKEFAAIRELMSDAVPIDPVLDARHVDPGPSELLEKHELIDRHFSYRSVEEILASLDRTAGAEAEWAKQTARKIRKGAPNSLKTAFHLVRNTGQPSLEDALALDAQLALIFLEREEFYEGIRAMLIDKDGAPHWSPKTLEEISEAEIAANFVPERRGFRPKNPFA